MIDRSHIQDPQKPVEWVCLIKFHFVSKSWNDCWTLQIPFAGKAVKHLELRNYLKDEHGQPIETDKTLIYSGTKAIQRCMKSSIHAMVRRRINAQIHDIGFKKRAPEGDLGMSKGKRARLL